MCTSAHPHASAYKQTSVRLHLPTGHQVRRVSSPTRARARAQIRGQWRIKHMGGAKRGYKPGIELATFLPWPE